MKDFVMTKRDIIPQTFRLSRDLVGAMNGYSEITGVSKTFMVEKAVREYLDRCGAGQANIDIAGIRNDI